MKNVFSLFFLVLLLTSQILGQDRPEYSKNVIYGEFGSLMVIGGGSFSYERMIHSSKKVKGLLYLRAGYNSTFVFDGIDGRGGQIGLTYLSGKKKNHHLFVGLGLALVNDAISGIDLSPFPIAELGWRYQKPQNSLIFIANVGTYGIELGLGYAFYRKKKSS